MVSRPITIQRLRSNQNEPKVSTIQQKHTYIDIENLQTKLVFQKPGSIRRFTAFSKNGDLHKKVFDPITFGASQGNLIEISIEEGKQNGMYKFQSILL